MGNFICPVTSPLASVARDICPFPDYNLSPLFTNMLSINSSRHLRDHYTEVQSSLNPKQLEDFTQNLRRTFGREGRVSYGGVGVVALSLAVLFDTLAKQARGEWVPDSGPIPGLFFKDLGGYYPPHVYTTSQYLRLVPHAANNPDRMRKLTERYLKKMKIEDQALAKSGLDQELLLEDISVLNVLVSVVLALDAKKIYLHINGTDSDELISSSSLKDPNVTFSLNCDIKTADQQFLAEVQKSDIHIQEAFKELVTDQQESLLLQVAKTDISSEFFNFLLCSKQTDTNIQRVDFDLKANALGTWRE
ncbi:uncharacterized protein LOC121520606 [Cheilinus undulatus]|uniref:uncharacterized protein LOC121520606 n=1 Tax=Cheilinus undulatus TaxID=241271 RepID=UPI001BD3E3EB|nr:uncharacterized protein LOC121520606 [Cheilinus undulatus]